MNSRRNWFTFIGYMTIILKHFIYIRERQGEKLRSNFHPPKK